MYENLTMQKDRQVRQTSANKPQATMDGRARKRIGQEASNLGEWGCTPTTMVPRTKDLVGASAAGRLCGNGGQE